MRRAAHHLALGIVLLSAIAVPAAAHAQDEDEGTRTTKGLYPLIYSRQDGALSEFGILGPLIQFQKEPGRSYTAFLPFFSHERDEPTDLTEMYFLWPFIHWERRGEETSWYAFPLLWHESDPVGGYTIGFPLYWSFWDRERSDGGSTRQSWFRTFFPLYWDFGKDPGASYFHIWPLYAHHRDGDEYEAWYTLFPFFRAFVDRKEDVFGLDFPYPLVGLRSGPGSFWAWAAPLFLYGRDREVSATSVTPLFGHIETEEKAWTWAFPLYFRHATQKYSLQAYLLNLLVLETSKKSKQLGILWPFISFWDDEESSGFRFAPLVWGSKTEESGWFLFAPLAFGRWSYASSDLFVFPLFYHNRRGAGEDPPGMTVLFPLFWDFRGSGSRFTMLFPLFGSHSDEEEHTRFFLPSIVDIQREDRHYFHAWPFYGRHTEGDHYRRHFFIWPFFSYGTDDRKDEWFVDLLWPIFHYASSPDSTTIRFLPFIWLERSKDSKTTGLFPFYFAGEGPDSDYKFIVPFYGRQRKGTWERKFYALGSYIKTTDPATELERHDVLYPLITTERQGENTFTAVRPLYWSWGWKEGSSTLFLPFYYRKDDGDKRQFWSLLYNSVERRSTETRWDNVLGFLYHRSRVKEQVSTEVLFPFFHAESGPEGSGFDFRPLFWHRDYGDSGHTVALPFYAHFWGKDRDAFNIIPFYTNIRRPDGSSVKSIFGPLYIRRESGGELQEDFLWPIGHHYKTLGVEKWQVRPLFWHENIAGRESRTILFPILWRYRSPNSSYFHLWPLFGTETWNEGSREFRRISTLYPFFSYTWDDSDRFRRFDFLFPIFRTQRDRDDARTWLFPLFFYDRERVGKIDDTDLYVLPPLFYYGAEGEDRSRWNILWKLVTYDREAGDFDFRVLWYLIRAKRQEDGSRFRIWPLVYWEKEPGGKDTPLHFSLLWPLIDYESSSKGSEFALLWKLFTWESGPELTRVRVLHYLFQYESSPSRFLLELNPIFSYEKTPRSTYFSVGGGLFSVEKKPEETDFGFLWFFEI